MDAEPESHLYANLRKLIGGGFLLKMQTTSFSPGIKLQMLGLGNPEIIAVRKHFSTSKIILFLLFPYYL